MYRIKEKKTNWKITGDQGEAQLSRLIRCWKEEQRIPFGLFKDALFVTLVSVCCYVFILLLLKPASVFSTK